jgi:thiamine biosynthesis lipoprotein ApbE
MLQYLMVMELRPGQAIATSGDYLQVKSHNGERFHHIIDPVKKQWLKPSEVNVAQVRQTQLLGDFLFCTELRPLAPAWSWCLRLA